jgi:hypothetical protein
MRPFIFLLFLSVYCKSQTDSAITVPLIGIHLGGQIPLADMAERFGPNLNAGGCFSIKTKKNWLFGIESNYFFGRNVKEDVTTQLKNPEGYITDNDGFPADIRITERGLGIHLFGGKVFRIGNVNPNSGLLITIGAGYLQHKINLYDAQQKIAAFKGNLKHGYDRLSAGISFTQFVGYLFLSERRMLNFYFGVEAYEGYTRSLRKLNYDTGLPDTRLRQDILLGLRAGWVLPLYKKRPNEFYYY